MENGPSLLIGGLPQVLTLWEPLQIIEEGWSAEHDDKHLNFELSQAAACYALHASGALELCCINLNALWPWHPNWWKPTNKRRDLVKAAALIVAEIERMDRQDRIDAEFEEPPL